MNHVPRLPVTWGQVMLYHTPDGLNCALWTMTHGEAVWFVQEGHEPAASASPFSDRVYKKTLECRACVRPHIDTKAWRYINTWRLSQISSQLSVRFGLHAIVRLGRFTSQSSHQKGARKKRSP